MARPIYDEIGLGYGTVRQEEPGVRDQLRAALGDAAPLLNVGAGAGSYEPPDRDSIDAGYRLVISPGL